MTRAWLVAALALAIAAPPAAWAKGDKKAGKAAKDKAKDKDLEKDDEESSDSGDDDDAGDDDTAKDKGQGKGKAKSDDEPAAASDEPKKQDLTGHDLATKKKTTIFEKDRFFVDKIDSEKTEGATLIQGSLTSSTLLYAESGGPYGPMTGDNGAKYNRIYTDLRLQTDFRHIKASRWEARIDGRIRAVVTPSNETLGVTPQAPATDVTGVHIQSGLTGQNEYELRELWLIRNGERSDVTIGRQFITDLAAVKIDGVRVDYASSKQFTLLGFGGLYPLRGSRSLTTDYIDLKGNPNAAGVYPDAGKFVGAGGFGAAYRTANAYGAFGGVILYPLAGETPRIFGTSNGYWRFGPKLDVYHFALVDLIGSNDALGAGSAGLTNLSAGVNYKPSQRLRMTGSFNRVDTETLNIQANAFLTSGQGNTIQNEVFIKRLATTQVRGSLSAGLGALQRFEITVALAFRERPAFNLSSPDGTVTQGFGAAKGAEVYGSITDRRSIKDLRLGADIIKTFAVGSIGFQRSEVQALRAFAGRELANGHGEWEAEVSYATSTDTNVGILCTNLADCFGQSTANVLSLGGTLYYRINRDWLAIGSAYLTRTDITRNLAMTTADPTINGLTGFARLAYRF